MGRHLITQETIVCDRCGAEHTYDVDVDPEELSAINTAPVRSEDLQGWSEVWLPRQIPARSFPGTPHTPRKELCSQCAILVSEFIVGDGPHVPKAVRDGG